MQDFIPGIEYTREEKVAMAKKAHEAARKEYETDINRTDPDHAHRQARVDAAVAEARAQLRRDGRIL